MKRFLLTALFVLIGSITFAQERTAIAVFPFEDMDNVLTRNESVLFYRRFSNEFVNKNNGRFRIVPRQDVEKLINTEAAFQLSDFSAKAKTAEMQRVLNGAQILSGYIGKMGSKITISISLFTYPELEQLPGGVDLDVANKDVLFEKVQELVQTMQDRLAAIPIKHPLMGAWLSGGGDIEFKNDGTFICSDWERIDENIVPNNTGRGSTGALWDRTEYLLAGNGTYTYTDGFITLSYTLSGSRTVNKLNTVSHEMEVVSRNNNYSEKGTCTTSYSISTDGKTLTFGGRDQFFEYYRGTGSSNDNRGTNYKNVFSKK